MEELVTQLIHEKFVITLFLSMGWILTIFVCGFYITHLRDIITSYKELSALQKEELSVVAKMHEVEITKRNLEK